MYPSWWKSDKPYRFMDCLEGMREIPDKAIDLILTDPPYGNHKHENAEKNATRGVRTKTNGRFGQYEVEPTKYEHFDWNRKRLTKDYFDEMFRISKNQIIFGGNYYTDYLKPGQGWIVWDKEMSGCFSECELAWTSFDRAIRRFKYRWNGMLQEEMGNKEPRIYPTQKPIKLFVWILNNYSNPNDLILDPFLGSGTTLRACRETGRTGLGFELNSNNEKIIADRSLQNIPDINKFISDI